MRYNSFQMICGQQQMAASTATSPGDHTWFQIWSDETKPVSTINP